jgi:FAD/FMN-containing dehydrogenase
MSEGSTRARTSALATITGEVYQLGDAGYEEARRRALWNARLPDRRPELIIRAANEADVVVAVRHARDHRMQIGIRSGGHSWSGAFMRSGGMLLDLSLLTAVEIDPGTRTARVQPGLTGDQFNARLREHDLFFPTGHCTSVGLGGFLLQGGFGWNSRVLGPACKSVIGVDLVTANGELVRATAQDNQELMWAARGAGPGFFGVVTGFHLALYPRPKAIMLSRYVFPFDCYPEVFGWAIEHRREIPRPLECMLFIGRDRVDSDEPYIALSGTVLEADEERARDALAFLDSCPYLEHALPTDRRRSCELADLLAAVDHFYPDGHRYAVDNMWTNATASELLPGLRLIGESLPTKRSHAMMLIWGPEQRPGDMAFSMEAELYLGIYGVWERQADDAAMTAWATDHMRKLEPLSVGIQLADENLGERPWPFLADANMRRLDHLRDRYDPTGLFHGYLRRPPIDAARSTDFAVDLGGMRP